MSLSIGGNNSIFNISGNKDAAATAAVSATGTPAYKMSSDSVNLSATASGPNQPLPMEAGTWKKISNSVGQVFSNMADSMGFGKTHDLIVQEYNQVDLNRSGRLEVGEFNVATLNLLDFWGSEFSKADTNRNGAVEKNEYVNYRKDQLNYMFERKEHSGDNHLNINEVGFIGQNLLANRDPRFDANQDGLINKREFVRSVVTGTMSIRDMLGF